MDALEHLSSEDADLFLRKKELIYRVFSANNLQEIYDRLVQESSPYA